MNRYDNEIAIVERAEDLLERALLVAALVSRLFREAGWSLVVVGGSAIEFFTEGSYMSGDIDLCRKSLRPIPLRKAQEIMDSIGATGGPRSWKFAGLYVDLLGFFEGETRMAERIIETELGEVALMPAELAIVERVLTAFYPQPSPSERDVAKKMLAVALSGKTPVNWDEVKRLAALPDFAIGAELEILKEEVARELREAY